MARMLPYLAQAARDAREASGKHQVHVAAALNVRESTIARFEKGEAWARNADATVNAYAEVIECDPRDLWTEALALWKADAALSETERETDALRERARPKRRRDSKGAP